MRKVLALSVQQPWAWLIVHGYKDIENRTWETNVRGEFAVHAGKKIDADAIAWIRQEFPEIPLPAQFDTGGIVGYAYLHGVVNRSDSRWFFGPHGFQLKDQRPCALIPCRGHLGFFQVEVPGV